VRLRSADGISHDGVKAQGVREVSDWAHGCACHLPLAGMEITAGSYGGGVCSLHRVIAEAQMEKENTPKIRIEHHPFLGLGWGGAWLFTIGFLHLGFWKAVLAIVLWPYYIGLNFSSLAR
jgi:hypothetical protein